MTMKFTVRPAAIADVDHLVRFNTAMAAESEDKFSNENQDIAYRMLGMELESALGWGMI